MGSTTPPTSPGSASGWGGAERGGVSASPPDFLVVGAGAAGGVVAKELATAGFRVVVLEQGPWLHERDFQHDEIWAHQRHALTNDFRRQPDTRRETESDVATLQPTITYGRMVGGGTVHFTANYWRFREIDFIERSRKGGVPGTGFDDWPITYAELEPSYTKAEWEIACRARRVEAPTSRRGAGRPEARLDRRAVPDGDPVAAIPGSWGLRAVRLLRGVRLRDRGEGQHARDRHPRCRPHGTL